MLAILTKSLHFAQDVVLIHPDATKVMLLCSFDSKDAPPNKPCLLNLYPVVRSWALHSTCSVSPVESELVGLSTPGATVFIRVHCGAVDP